MPLSRQRLHAVVGSRSNAAAAVDAIGGRRRCPWPTHQVGRHARPWREIGVVGAVRPPDTWRSNGSMRRRSRRATGSDRQRRSRVRQHVRCLLIRTTKPASPGNVHRRCQAVPRAVWRSSRMRSRSFGGFHCRSAASALRGSLTGRTMIGRDDDHQLGLVALETHRSGTARRGSGSSPRPGSALTVVRGRCPAAGRRWRSSGRCRVRPWCRRAARSAPVRWIAVLPTRAETVTAPVVESSLTSGSHVHADPVRRSHRRHEGEATP